MIYLVEFIIDNGCREDKYIAIVKAQNTGEAMFKFHQYIYPKLKNDEIVSQERFTTLKEENDILYCDYE